MISVRRGGLSSIRGNSIAFPQDVSGVANKLPRLPQDMPYIYLTRSKDDKQVKLKIRVKETVQALRDLKAISSVYDDIEISEENIAFYENCNGEFNPPHVLHQEWESSESEQPRAGPMTDEIEVEEISDKFDFDAPNPNSVVPQNVNNKTSKELLKKAIMPDEEEEIIDSQMTLGSDFSNNDSQDKIINAADGEEMEVVETMPYPTLAPEPLSEFSLGYYQKCFPGKKYTKTEINSCLLMKCYFVLFFCRTLPNQSWRLSTIRSVQDGRNSTFQRLGKEALFHVQIGKS